MELQQRSNVFTIEEIWRRSLGAFILDQIRLHVRRYAHEKDPHLEPVGHIDDDKIRLTDRGRNVNCEGL